MIRIPKEPVIASSHDYLFRAPRLDDVGDIWRMVKGSDILDSNSSYCYLVLCKYFAPTCVTVHRDGRLVGFATALVLPGDPTRLFVWQVGVDEAARGQGLAKRMLRHLLVRPECAGVTHLETTVAPGNVPSRALFASLARDLRTTLEQCETYAPETFPEVGHEPEQRLLLGPFDPAVLERS